MIDVNEAISLILNQNKEKEIEEINMLDATGMILAEDVVTDRDYPPFHRATMDGYAIRHEDLEPNAQTSLKLAGEIFAGQDNKLILLKGNCIRIMTGAALPKGADTVIKIEDTVLDQDKIVFNPGSHVSGKNIAVQGEDIRNKELLLGEGSIMNHISTGMLVSIGRTKVKVYKKPVITVLATGDELKNPGESIQRHQIRDSNSWVIRSMLRKFSIEPKKTAIVRDDPDELRREIKDGLNSDILIINGGVSMGSADFVPSILLELGVTKIFHKVSIKPGKPIWFGVTNQGKLVFGLPGNPFSVQVCFFIFVMPAIRSFMGKKQMNAWRLPLKSSHKKNTKGRDEYFLGSLDSQMHLTPLSINGSGDIRAGVNSDGLCIHYNGKEMLKKGELVDFFPWNDWSYS